MEPFTILLVFSIVFSCLVKKGGLAPKPSFGVTSPRRCPRTGSNGGCIFVCRTRHKARVGFSRWKPYSLWLSDSTTVRQLYLYYYEGAGMLLAWRSFDVFLARASLYIRDALRVGSSRLVVKSNYAARAGWIGGWKAFSCLFFVRGLRPQLFCLFWVF